MCIEQVVTFLIENWQSCLLLTYPDDNETGIQNDICINIEKILIQKGWHKKDKPYPLEYLYSKGRHIRQINIYKRPENLDGEIIKDLCDRQGIPSLIIGGWEYLRYINDVDRIIIFHPENFYDNQNTEISEKTLKNIQNISGGFSVIAKNLLKNHNNNFNLTELLKLPDISNFLDSVWERIPFEYQNTLISISTRINFHKDNKVQALERLGLIRKDNGGYSLSIGLMDNYINNIPSKNDRQVDSNYTYEEETNQQLFRLKLIIIFLLPVILILLFNRSLIYLWFSIPIFLWVFFKPDIHIKKRMVITSFGVIVIGIGLYIISYGNITLQNIINIFFSLIGPIFVRLIYEKNHSLLLIESIPKLKNFIIEFLTSGRKFLLLTLIPALFFIRSIREDPYCSTQLLTWKGSQIQSDGLCCQILPEKQKSRLFDNVIIKYYKNINIDDTKFPSIYIYHTNISDKEDPGQLIIIKDAYKIATGSDNEISLDWNLKCIDNSKDSLRMNEINNDQSFNIVDYDECRLFINEAYEANTDYPIKTEIIISGLSSDNLHISITINKFSSESIAKLLQIKQQTREEINQAFPQLIVFLIIGWFTSAIFIYGFMKKINNYLNTEKEKQRTKTDYVREENPKRISIQEPIHGLGYLGRISSYRLRICDWRGIDVRH